MAVFCNVFLGMQLSLSSYLQVCFSILNDVIMSISLMYEKPESGKRCLLLRYYRTLLNLLPYRPDAPQTPECSHRSPDRLALLHPDLLGKLAAITKYRT